MMKTLTCASVLTAHPRTSSVSVNAIDARLTYGEGKTLTLVYQLKGDMARLRVPFPQSSQRTDGLWQHTCFEAFIKASARADYYEFNFSPSGEWAAYAFRGYRDGGPLDDDWLDPAISVKSEDDCLELIAVVRLNCLPVIEPGQILQLGLSAVVEENDGKLSYWALKHPVDKPDFHHPDSFALELALPERSA
jgi:hypothetical protein